MSQEEENKLTERQLVCLGSHGVQMSIPWCGAGLASWELGKWTLKAHGIPSFPTTGPTIFLNTCMICMHGWKCVRMCVHICMFSCAHAWGGQRTTSGVVLRNIVHLLWDRVSPLAWSSPIRLDCWPRGPRDPCVSAFQHWDYRADSASCRPWDS